MFKLLAGERIKACYSLTRGPVPVAATWACQSPACDRMTHRIIVIDGPNGEKFRALCGVHFLLACRDCPDLQVAELALLLSRMNLAMAV